MNLYEQLLVAQDFSEKKHEGQLDRAANPYINHVRAVAELSLLRIGTIGEIIGWLHDVIEDTDATYQDLYDLGIDPEIVGAVYVLTRKRNNSVPEKYHDEFIARIAYHPLARHVKIVDLKHNLSRIDNLPISQRERMRRRYEKALEMLGEKI